MSEKSTSRSRALSAIISAVILSAVVMAVGGTIWAYSQGAMTITAKDYAEAVIDTTDIICERFIIEHVSYDDPTLSIWLYNYGGVDIVVDVYADVDEGDSGSSTDYEIPSGAFEKAEISLTISSCNEVAIKVVSRRDNNVYYRYIIP